ncbi:MAG TPA: NAD-dependent epimerase/dehydratase family protein [Bacteroidales bacterium]|nr:NAD-dependent epimerase/dehydratase family protein [Bacteroidales bacterium]HRZ50080.1 NAD-dependent epimerase/dehydratase family protein [Bacteroidales bacterium]
MATLITGATGLIGSKLAGRLAESGEEVRAWVRPGSEQRLPDHPQVIPVVGNLSDAGALQQAMKGCEGVFHLAAFTGVWHRDPGFYFRINVDGTRNVLLAAREAGVKCLVITSTAGVFPPSVNGEIIDETTPCAVSCPTWYEESKVAMEQMIHGFPAGGMRIVIVNPTRLYGPGPLGKSNSVTRMLVQYLRGKWHWLPGNGQGVGNYAFIDDVVEGHVAAMAHGWHKARYILGGWNLSYSDLFRRAGEVCGRQSALIPLPLPLMMAASAGMKGMAQLTGREPLITPGWVRKYSHSWYLSPELATKKLGYTVTPFEQGISRIIEYYRI